MLMTMAVVMLMPMFTMIMPMFAMIMPAAVWKQAMRMVGSSMQHLIHDDIDKKTTSCCDEHDHGGLNELTVDDTVSRLINHKEY